MPTIDRKPPGKPSLISIAARLAREGRGGEAMAVRDAADEILKLKKRLADIEEEAFERAWEDR